LATELITTAADLAALAPAWDALWRRSPEATPFQSPQWLLPWLTHFGAGGELATVATRDGEALTSIAPLYVLREDDESLGLLLGTGISDYLDMLGDGAAALDALQTIDCQLWDLQQLRPSSTLLTATLPGGLAENVEDQEPCPILRIEGASEELESLLSTHARKKLRYYRRSLERLGDVCVEEATEDNLDALLETLYALHAARWRRRNLPGVLADAATQQFHHEVARNFLRAGALRMYATRVEGRVVAIFYGFAHGATVYYYLSGYEPELEKLSIGTLIVAHALERAISDGATTFDFLRGAEEYKYAWGASDRMNRRRQIFRAM
jgi:CelD/BcsL family acetyltransferase involved in cellulose biosynthesis